MGNRGLPTRRSAGVVALAGVLIASAAFVGCSHSSGGKTSSSKTPATPQTPAPLTISAASSLKSVLESITPSFETSANAKVTYNFAASGVLAKQIEGGAPVDVFLSASGSQVTTLVAEGLASAETTVAFAGNRLAIIMPVKSDFRVASAADLAHLGHIATGDPASVPQGAKAEEWLKNVGMWDTLKSHLVYTANAAQTADYVARGEVDAGIGYVSDANLSAGTVVSYIVPNGAIKPIRYVGVGLVSATDTALAQQYLDFLLSPAAQSAFAEAGLVPVADFAKTAP